MPATRRPRAAAGAAALAVLLAGAAACSSGGTSSTASTTAAASTSSADATGGADGPGGGTTTAPASTTAAPSSPSEPAATHVAAADRLFEDWKGGNRDDALKVARPQAVDALFAHDPSGWYEYTYGNELGTFCDTGEFDQGTCNVRDDSGHYAKILLTHDQRGWIVDSVVVSDNLGSG